MQAFVGDDKLAFTRCFYLRDDLELLIESILGFPGLRFVVYT